MGKKNLMLVFVCSLKRLPASCGAPLCVAGTSHRLKNEVSDTVNEACKEEKSSLRDTGDLAELCRHAFRGVLTNSRRNPTEGGNMGVAGRAGPPTHSGFTELDCRLLFE